MQQLLQKAIGEAFDDIVNGEDIGDDIETAVIASDAFVIMEAGVGPQGGQGVTKAGVGVGHEKIGHGREDAAHGVATEIEILAGATAGRIHQVNMIHRLIQTPGNALEVFSIPNHIREECGMHTCKTIQFPQGRERVGFEVRRIIHEPGICGESVGQNNDGGNGNRLPVGVLIHDMPHQVGDIDEHAGTGAASHRADDEDLAFAFLHGGGVQRGPLILFRFAIHKLDGVDNGGGNGVVVPQEEGCAANGTALLRAPANIQFRGAEDARKLFVLKPIHVGVGSTIANVGKDAIHAHARWTVDHAKFGGATTFVKALGQLCASETIAFSQFICVE